MDGCYNMLEVIYPDVNETVKHLYDDCVEICDNQYMKIEKE